MTYFEKSYSPGILCLMSIIVRIILCLVSKWVWKFFVEPPVYRVAKKLAHFFMP